MSGDPRARSPELDRLRAEVAALEQLLEVHEQTAAEEARRRQTIAEALEEKNRSLLESEREKNEALARLRVALAELSTPILEVWDDILALPLIGVVDSHRSAEIMERLLGEVTRQQCRHVIIDVTGVEVIDTATASHFVKLVRAVELLGARCVLTGIRPAVAHALVSIGVDLGSLATLRNLKHGLRECLRSDGGK